MNNFKHKFPEKKRPIQIFPQIMGSSNTIDQSFGKAAETPWNNLPVTIRKFTTLDVFMKKAKTKLFPTVLTVYCIC